MLLGEIFFWGALLFSQSALCEGSVVLNPLIFGFSSCDLTVYKPQRIGIFDMELLIYFLLIQYLVIIERNMLNTPPTLKSQDNKIRILDKVVDLFQL